MKEELLFLRFYPSKKRPSSFKKINYIRVGSYTKNLRDHEEKEQRLWESFTRGQFEKGVAMENVEADNILKLIDYPLYFKKMNETIPGSHSAILERLSSEKIIMPRDLGTYDITNLGAILFATNLNDFDHLASKTPRVITYKEKK